MQSVKMEKTRYHAVPKGEDQTPRTQGCKTKKVVLISLGVAVLIGVCIAVVVVMVNRREDHQDKNIIILTMFDGFRHDYIHRGLTPRLLQLAEEGVLADSMISQFPSSTYSNHFSIVTGIYPESHGFADNSFYDSKIGKFSGQMSNRTKLWLNGEPIWDTVGKHGLKSASVWWWTDVWPTYYVPHGSNPENFTHEMRVRQVLEWLKLDSDKRPSFIMLYFDEPDSLGHRYGPNSAEVNSTLRDLDQAMALLVDGIKALGLQHKVNIIGVGDHGMTEAPCSKAMNLSQIFNVSSVSMMLRGEPVKLYTDHRDEIPVLDSKLKCAWKELTSYNRKDLLTPKRLHMGFSRRIGDLALSADLGWQLTSSNYSCTLGKVSDTPGRHGYDPLYKDMHTIFFANGPDFKQGLKIESISNVELYYLFTDILRLPSAPNNGTHGSLLHILSEATAATVSLRKSNGDSSNLDQICELPKRLDEAVSSCGKCTCDDCPDARNLSLLNFYKQFIYSADEVAGFNKLHLPWGLPVGGAGLGGCILTQKESVTGYSSKLRVPLWTAYKLSSPVNTTRTSCFFDDLRVPANNRAGCGNFLNTKYWKRSLGLLGPNLLSHVIPQADASYLEETGLWSELEKFEVKLSKERKAVHVISGSIFDSNNDGLRDRDSDIKRWLHNAEGTVAIPTHFYKIYATCADGGANHTLEMQCGGYINTLSFIVPHYEEPLCQLRSLKEYMQRYVASIKDIELLTGTSFFNDLPVDRQARLKTFLNVDWKL